MARPKKEKIAADFRQINANVLVQLIKTKAENKVAIAELNGELGSQIKNHIEMSGLNKSAFGFLAKINGMKEQDRDSCLDALSLYCDMMIEKGLWPKHLGDLAAQAEAASQHGPSDDEQEDDPRPQFMKDNEQRRLDEEAAAREQVASNVTQLQRGIRQTEAVA